MGSGITWASDIQDKFTVWIIFIKSQWEADGKDVQRLFQSAVQPRTMYTTDNKIMQNQGGLMGLTALALLWLIQHNHGGFCQIATANMLAPNA